MLGLALLYLWNCRIIPAGLSADLPEIHTMQQEKLVVAGKGSVAICVDLHTDGQSITEILA